MDTLNKEFGQVHEDVDDFRKQVIDVTDQLRKAFDDLQLEIRLRDSDNSDSDRRLRKEFVNKAESLQEDIKDFQGDFHQTKQKLLNEVHELDARAHSTGRAVGGIHDQLVLITKQITEEINTVEENLTPKIDRVASDVQIWREEMTKSVNETSGAVRALHEEVVPMKAAIQNIDQRHQGKLDSLPFDGLDLTSRRSSARRCILPRVALAAYHWFRRQAKRYAQHTLEARRSCQTIPPIERIFAVD